MPFSDEHASHHDRPKLAGRPAPRSYPTADRPASQHARSNLPPYTEMISAPGAGNAGADEQQAEDLVDHQRAPETDAAPFDGVHPVRLALVLEVVDLLQRHGYQRTATARSLARFLRHLNALVKAYEAGN